MNNHHDIVYVFSREIVKNDNGSYIFGNNDNSELLINTEERIFKIKPLKDVFVFTKEELDKRDKDKWISTKDALPKESGTVLIVFQIEPDHECFIVIGQYDVALNDWYLGKRRPFIVTHWQPLPEIPSKK